MGLLETHLSLWELTARMALALAFAAVIGWERGVKGRPAGLRTHMMVALGAAGFTLVAMELLAQAPRDGRFPLYDPIRIVSSIVVGVGFLGTGAIIHAGAEVRGLTTAASIWVVAAVGMASGCGLYLVALLLSLLALVTLTAIKVHESRFVDRRKGE